MHAFAVPVPFGLQVAHETVVQPAGAQTWPISRMFVQVFGLQHWELAVHPAPVGRHWVVGTVQRRMPEASGTQGAKLQHWSRNWQIWPSAMQQFGSEPVQPFGHTVVAPPKQRQIWFESSLQTACLPLQQFCEAFAPPAPQMLPGGLHEPPLSQRWSVVLQFTYWLVWVGG